MDISIIANIKHTRVVDEQDKYFFIKILLTKNQVIAEVGWIEKEFNKEQFGSVIKQEFTVLNIIEFKNKEEYDNYKSEL
jgi:hypothetical protein